MENLTLKELTKILKSSEKIQISAKKLFFRKVLASFILISSDFLFLSLSLFVSLILRDISLEKSYIFAEHFSYIPLAVTPFIFTFYLRGLYPGFGVDVVQEYKSLSFGTIAIFLGLATISLFAKDFIDISRLAFLYSVVLSLILLPTGRAIVRKVFGNKNWWGIPVIVIGAGNTGESIIKSLKKNNQIGLRPIIAIDDNVDKWGYFKGVPVIGGLDVIPELTERLQIEHAIIAMPKVTSKRQHEIIAKYSDYFEHTLVIPDLFAFSSLWVSSKEVGGILGLEVQKRLIRSSAAITKRFIDITLGIILSILMLPFIALIAAIIKLDSKGKVFFRQERMGIKDSRFKMIKFRTMHVDAEERLQDILHNDKELHAEYEIYHKLSNDPRLTRFGKILRKFSLDELPQLWNVLKGDMSLIGPRAYMPWEKIKMRGHEEMILKVKPGMSGLWQVTDRNRSSFEERNNTDVYYIRNWSLFLDIFILFRTFLVVFSGKGE